MERVTKLALVDDDTRQYIQACKEARKELVHERRLIVSETSNISRRINHPDYARWIKIRARLKELSDESLASELNISRYLVEQL